MSTLSQEALKLAAMIRQLPFTEPAGPSATQIAEIIDRELALPARNAALLCAQGVVDAASNALQDTISALPIDELRDALARIGKP